MVYELFIAGWHEARNVLETDKIIFIFSLFVSLPLAQLFRIYLSRSRASAVTRHIVSAVLGIWIAWLCCGWYVLHLLVLAFACYGAMFLVRAEYTPWVVFLLSFSCLSYVHIERVFASPDDYTIDISGRLMLMVQKVTFVAWHMYDNKKQIPVDAAEKEKDDGSKHGNQESTPSLLSYFSYLFHFASLLVGPVVSYKEYVDYIEGDDVKRCTTEESKQDPSPYGKAAESLLAVLLCSMCYVIGRKYCKLENLADPEFVDHLGFAGSVVFLSFGVRVIRARYYFAWKMGEASASLSGLGFSGYDRRGRSCWKNCDSVNIVSVETESNILIRIRNWNIFTHLWLKRCVYTRLPFLRKELTYVVSGIWHGFYPGYFFCVPTIILLVVSNHQISKKLLPFHRRCSITTQFLINAVWWLYDEVSLVYAMAPFMLMTYSRSTLFFRNMYYCGHIASVVLLVVSFLIPGERQPTVDANGNRHATNGINDHGNGINDMKTKKQ